MHKAVFLARLRAIFWSAGQAGVIMAGTFFVFQVTQSWVDFGISQSFLRWILPSAFGIASAAAIGLILLLLNLRHGKRVISPVEDLATAILEYGFQLHKEGRDKALLNLRNNFSITLHILGFHDIRIKLGELSLQSATIVQDNTAKAKILIDDLGWANHLLGYDKIAIDNIRRGVDLAAESLNREKHDEVDLRLTQAKGLRHLALVTTKDDYQSADAILLRAIGILESLPDQNYYKVKRDIAQVYHARAMMIAIILNIHRSGKIRPGDTEAAERIDSALQEVRKATAIFRDIGDQDRYTKALFMEVRLLEAKGADIEALEARALRDRTLASSEWIRPNGTRTLTGV